MEDCVCTETQNVTFEVELSHSGIDAYWTLKSQPLKAGPKYKIESKGKRYSLTIINAMKDEEGQYEFAAGEKTSSAKLTVSGMIFVSCQIPLDISNLLYIDAASRLWFSSNRRRYKQATL